MSSLLERADAYFRHELWRRDLDREPFFIAWPLHWVRCIAMAVDRGIAHQLPIRASALTFITVLSLVPSLAFAFSIAKSLGVYEKFRLEVVEPFLEDMFVQPESAPSVAEDGAAGAVDDVAVEGIDESTIDESALDGTLDVDDGETLGKNLADGVLDGIAGEGEGANEQESGDAADDGDGASDAGAASEVAGDDANTEASADEPQQLRVAIEQVMEFVEKTDVKQLGALGFLVVIYAVIRLLGGVEAALNLIWSVDRPRRVIRKLTDYLGIVILGPVAAVVAIFAKSALSTGDSAVLVYLRDDLGLGNLIVWFEGVLPILSMLVVFTLVYQVMPNTRVKVRSSLVGGLVAAILWTVMLELFVKAQVGVSSYNQLYASFAAFPIFLMWLWFSWLVVLAGAEVGYADQHARAYRRQALAESGNQAWYEYNVLRALGRIVGAFGTGTHPPVLVDLVDDLGVPEAELERGLARLESRGLLVRIGEGEEVAYGLARPADQVSVHDALEMLRGTADDALEDEADDATLDTRLRRAYRDAVRAGGEPRTLADVADVPAAPVQADRDAASESDESESARDA